MSYQHKKTSLLSLIFLFTSTLSVSAGEVVKVTTKDLNQSNAQEETMTFLFSDGFMKMQDEENTDVIFSSNDQHMLVISHSDQSYMIMDKDTGSNIKNEMDKMIEQALANVPPEQRAMVEQMMKQQMNGAGGMGGMPGMGGGQMPQMEESETEVRQTGRDDKINGYDCTYYETYENGEKQDEFCVASWSELGVSDNIQQSFKSMGEFIEGFIEQFSQMAPIRSEGNPFAYMNEIDGFPVYGKNFENGRAIQESTLSSITEQDLDINLFKAPDGYTQQNIMGMGQ